MICICNARVYYLRAWDLTLQTRWCWRLTWRVRCQHSRTGMGGCLVTARGVPQLYTRVWWCLQQRGCGISKRGWRGWEPWAYSRLWNWKWSQLGSVLSFFLVSREIQLPCVALIAPCSHLAARGRWADVHISHWRGSCPYSRFLSIDKLNFSGQEWKCPEITWGVGVWSSHCIRWGQTF